MNNNIILEHIKAHPGQSSKQIADAFADETSLATVKRGLNELVSQFYIYAEGKARATKYYVSPLFAPVDLDVYFSKEVDERQIQTGYNFDLIPNVLSRVSLFTEKEMQELYNMGIRILFFCGGETFLWKDGERNLRDLVIEAKRMGFLIVNVVTNGTFPLDLPEANLILLSLDGDKERHNNIRSDTYDTIMKNIASATADNICFYMAINQINKNCIRHVCLTARDTKNVRAVSFNFHTPYPDTKELALSREEKEQACRTIKQMMKEGAPVFNLKSAFPYLINNSFPTPCHQCVVIENGKLSVCGRCIDVPGLCEQCG